MTNDDRKWAWDTRPSDGGPPRPVYIGDKEDWNLSSLDNVVPAPRLELGTP